MKKTERIVYLLTELEKELNSIPEELAMLLNKQSEYDTLNSEVYHSILSFNPSASESAKLIGAWKKQLVKRGETKQEMCSLNALRKELEPLNESISKMLTLIQDSQKKNPFVFQTTLAQEVIFDSFNNYEERNRFPYTVKTKDSFLHPEGLPEQREKVEKPDVACKPVTDAKENILNQSLNNRVIKVIKIKRCYFIYDGVDILAFFNSIDEAFYYIRRHGYRNLCIDASISEEKLRSVIQVILNVFEKESEQKRFIKMIRSQRFNPKASLKQACVTFSQKNKSA